MEKFSLDRDWLFHLGDIEKPDFYGHTYCYMAAKAGGATGAANPSYSTDNWEKVNLPHDWSVYGEFDERHGPSQGYKPRGTGWYIKKFRLEEEDLGKQLLVEFGGISSHAIVYCNGSVVARNFCGYTSFVADITDMALYGDKINTISVFVDATQIEGWWYEGAGIYRHVYLYKKSPAHIKHWGVFVNPQKTTADVWDTKIEVTVENSNYEKTPFTVKTKIKNDNGTVIGHTETTGEVDGGSDVIIDQSILAYSPDLWDIDSPTLYTAVCELYIGDNKIDDYETTFGYRTISISADNGFFLNGRRVNLYGTCNHQDHAGVGVAVPDSVNEYRIKLLKEMGTNAYRCAHGNPSVEILDYCDKYGMLVMDENRNFNSSPEGVEQTKSMVLRDRNHPCVIMYSVFNEEPLQGTPTGRNLAERLACEIRKLDDTRFILGAMNTGVLDEKGCANLLDMTGFNYITHTFDPFREKMPTQPMIGSENNSAFQTRGVYKTDHEKNIIDSYDTEAAPWGNTHRDGFKQIDTRPHIMGMFVWTGFDYRGEPTPFEWPSIGTQFGIMDTCGFKKDAFYLNKAFFTKEPMIHVLPHWNHEGHEGQKIKVMVHTNCDESELFLNNVSQGKKSVDKYDMAEWLVSYEKGTIRMVGYNNGITVCEDSQTTTGTPKRVVIESVQDYVYNGCMDAVIVNAYVVDENGSRVPTAANKITFSIEGGQLIGVGNGDPNSHESDKLNFRNLFAGYCQAIFQQTDGSKELKITAEADGLIPCEIIIPVLEKENVLPYIPSIEEVYITKWRKTVALSKEKPNPNVKIEDHDMNTWAIITAGEGIESAFKDATGFLLYKTEFNILDNGLNKAICFKELQGNNVEIYINGELKYQGDCKWARYVEIELDKSVHGTIDISIIIESTSSEDDGGIINSIVVIDK